MKQKYHFYDGYPYYPLNSGEGYMIRSANVCHVKDNKVIKEWFFSDVLPESFSKEWFQNLWRDLETDPFSGHADQWSSEYYSIIQDRIIVWYDDRKECSNFISYSLPLENSIEDPSLSKELREWLKKSIKDRSEREIPGPPDNTP